MSKANLATRYTNFVTNCNVVAGPAITKYSSIKDHDNSRREAYHQLNKDLGAI